MFQLVRGGKLFLDLTDYPFSFDSSIVLYRLDFDFLFCLSAYYTDILRSLLGGLVILSWIQFYIFLYYVQGITLLTTSLLPLQIVTSP